MFLGERCSANVSCVLKWLWYQSTDVPSIQNTIVNCLPAVTKVGQLLVSVDEFFEGDGLVLVVVCGLSVYVVEDAFMMLWVEQILVGVVGDCAVLGYLDEHFEQHPEHLVQLPVCTVHQKN